MCRACAERACAECVTAPARGRPGVRSTDAGHATNPAQTDTQTQEQANPRSQTDKRTQTRRAETCTAETRHRSQEHGGLRRRREADHEHLQAARPRPGARELIRFYFLSSTMQKGSWRDVRFWCRHQKLTPLNILKNIQKIPK